MLKSSIAKLFLYSISWSIICSPALAQQNSIYVSTDSSGRTVYSNSSSSGASKQMILPPLGQENLDKKIDFLNRTTPKSCEKHGGINCAAGPDIDKSVICLDNTRDAELLFKDFCVLARLKITDVVLVTPQGDSISIDKKSPVINQITQNEISTILVTARNQTDVEAKGVQAQLRLTKYTNFTALGPTTIGPYEMAEYTFSTSEIKDNRWLKYLSKSSFLVSCSNCE